MKFRGTDFKHPIKINLEISWLKVISKVALVKFFFLQRKGLAPFFATCFTTDVTDILFSNTMEFIFSVT